jgi:hypothetical protein
MLVAIPTWFVGGLLVGLLAPLRAWLGWGGWLELVLAMLLVATATSFLLFEGQTVKTMPAVLYGALAFVGLLFAVIGAHFGQRMQAGAPRPAARAKPSPQPLARK